VQKDAKQFAKTAILLSSVLVGDLLALAGPLQVGDQLGGDPAAGLPGRIPRPDPGRIGHTSTDTTQAYTAGRPGRRHRDPRRTP
jgi:hypothetical protein